MVGWLAVIIKGLPLVALLYGELLDRKVGWASNHHEENAWGQEPGNVIQENMLDLFKQHH